jgi:hypothetical protein
MGLYIQPIGSSGSGFWARTEPMPTHNNNKLKKNNSHLLLITFLSSFLALDSYEF